jgi:hypothetical protein
MEREDNPIRKYTLELLLFEDISIFEKYITILSQDDKTASTFHKDITKLILKAKYKNILIPMLNEKLATLDIDKSIL